MLRVYTTDGCHRCGVAMKRLDAEGIQYTVINVSHDEEGAARLKRAGITEVPVFGHRGHLLPSIAALPGIIKDYKEKAA